MTDKQPHRKARGQNFPTPTKRATASPTGSTRVQPIPTAQVEPEIRRTATTRQIRKMTRSTPPNESREPGQKGGRAED
ncbi:uncharacterized protein BO95DRAFT_165309 [Aspergillus brunneoviolaceus CBS 621.78]|uniref:Uncharacterized protein n=1 Tax=Aspergillus brunneoviolaceus CBS 621.78 TaxID=1450534 RepID=A0ACD1G6A7_9EURO|nr:hypothetical protein BO95DRAFT_165309 [Aspergillus brunneoviolaceus CBS 621.78]RAH44802.1 hypothetical protein BO95DRAFT_165309 [Aspergillus brunneoviolaceus CBS 621.78]